MLTTSRLRAQPRPSWASAVWLAALCAAGAAAATAGPLLSLREASEWTNQVALVVPGPGTLWLNGTALCKAPLLSNGTSVQGQAAACLQAELSKRGALASVDGFHSEADNWGGMSLALPASAVPPTDSPVRLPVAALPLNVTRLASAVAGHPMVGSAARRWLSPPARMTKRERDASPRDRRLSALAASLFADAFCMDASELGASTALHVLSMPTDADPIGEESAATGTADGSAATSATGLSESAPRRPRVLSAWPTASVRVASGSAAESLRDAVAPLHRPWQQESASGLSRLLEPLSKPPEQGGKVSCPALDRPAGTSGLPADSVSVVPVSDPKGALRRRTAALAWAWAMVRSRSFDVQLPIPRPGFPEAGVVVRELDAKDKAKQRMKQAKASKSKSAKAKAQDKAPTTLSDNALVPLFDLANTPPPGWKPALPGSLLSAPAPTSDTVGAAGGPPAADVALVAAGLNVENASATGLALPDSIFTATDRPAGTPPTSWVVLQARPWHRRAGPPLAPAGGRAASEGAGAVEGVGEAAEAASQPAPSVPLWLAYTGEPGSVGATGTSSAPGAAAGAMTRRRFRSDAVSPVAELGSLLRGARCGQEWWTDYGFVPGGDAASLKLAAAEWQRGEALLHEAVDGAVEDAHALMSDKSTLLALSDAVTRARQQRRASSAGGKSQRKARGTRVTAADANKTVVAEALAGLRSARNKAQRAASERVWAGQQHPPADCAAVRLYTQYKLTEEDQKSDANPAAHTLSPKTGLLRTTGLIPSLMLDGPPGFYKLPPKRGTVDITSLSRAPAPALFAALPAELAAEFAASEAIRSHAAVALAASRALDQAAAAAAAAAVAAALEVGDDQAAAEAKAAAAAAESVEESTEASIRALLALRPRPAVGLPTGLLAAASALAATEEDVVEAGGPIAAASILEIPLVSAKKGRLAGGRKRKAASLSSQAGSGGRIGGPQAVIPQGRQGSHAEMRALKSAVEERAAVALRGLMTSTRDGAVEALRALAGGGAAGRAVQSAGGVGTHPETALGAAVALRLAGFAVEPNEGEGKPAEAVEVDPSSGETSSVARSPARLGDDVGGLPPDVDAPDAALDGMTLVQAEAALPHDIRVVVHAHASALRALAAAAQGAELEAEAALQESLAAASAQFNPGRN